jgi:hypothetical protein
MLILYLGCYTVWFWVMLPMLEVYPASIFRINHEDVIHSPLRLHGVVFKVKHSDNFTFTFTFTIIHH